MHPLRIGGALALLGLLVRFFEPARVARREAKHEPKERWEGEGGAVPVARNRIAAQVTPEPGVRNDGG